MFRRTSSEIIGCINISSQEGRIEVLRAYEFAVEQVGQDLNALTLWMDYISYLKALPARFFNFSVLCLLFVFVLCS